jgi:hypothetical protein
MLALVAVVARISLLAARTRVAPARPLAAVLALGLLVRSFRLGRFEILVAIVAVVIVALAALVLILEPGSALAQHAKIVIGELEIIFGLHAVARELRVARHALVFLEELGGIAALAIVLAVPRLSAEIPSSLSPTAAPAAALSIIDQMPTSLRSSG